jgi:hypothetical protein
MMERNLSRKEKEQHVARVEGKARYPGIAAWRRADPRHCKGCGVEAPGIASLHPGYALQSLQEAR